LTKHPSPQNVPHNKQTKAKYHPQAGENESTMLTAQKLFPYTKLHADLCIVNQQTHQTKQKYMDL
jgi:hypothetical protein